MAEHVEHAAEHGVPDGNGDGSARGGDFRAELQALRAAHRDAAHSRCVDVLLHLDDQLAIMHFDGKRVVQIRESLTREGDVDNRADNLRHATSIAI